MSTRSRANPGGARVLDMGEVRPYRERKPPWFKVRAPGGPKFLELKGMIDREGLTGVWVGDRKIGSIGLHVSRGVTIRCRSPNAWAIWKAARLRKQLIAPVRPVSTYSDVIRTPSIPHGTIHSNGWRSQSTLTAKPCMVTPRET